MRDRGVIYSGLLIFLGLITFPVWHDLAAGTTSRGPEPILPAQEKQCVAPLSYMRTSHMHLLMDWRDSVVRHGVHSYKAFNGKTYRMSLTGLVSPPAATRTRPTFATAATTTPQPQSPAGTATWIRSWLAGEMCRGAWPCAPTWGPNDDKEEISGAQRTFAGGRGRQEGDWRARGRGRRTGGGCEGAGRRYSLGHGGRFCQVP